MYIFSKFALIEFFSQTKTDIEINTLKKSRKYVMTCPLTQIMRLSRQFPQIFSLRFEKIVFGYSLNNL